MCLRCLYRCSKTKAKILSLPTRVSFSFEPRGLVGEEILTYLALPSNAEVVRFMIHQDYCSGVMQYRAGSVIIEPLDTNWHLPLQYSA